MKIEIDTLAIYEELENLPFVPEIGDYLRSARKISQNEVWHYADDILVPDVCYIKIGELSLSKDFTSITNEEIFDNLLGDISAELVRIRDNYSADIIITFTDKTIIQRMFFRDLTDNLQNKYGDSWRTIDHYTRGYLCQDSRAILALTYGFLCSKDDEMFSEFIFPYFKITMGKDKTIPREFSSYCKFVRDMRLLQEFTNEFFDSVIESYNKSTYFKENPDISIKLQPGI